MAAKKKPTKATKTKSDGSNERAEVRRQMSMKGGRILKRESEYNQDAVTRNLKNQEKARDIRTTNARFKPVTNTAGAIAAARGRGNEYSPNRVYKTMRVPLFPDFRVQSPWVRGTDLGNYKGAGSAANAASSGRKNPVKGSPRPPDRSSQRAENQRNMAKKGKKK